MEAVEAATDAGERKAVTGVQPRPGESCSPLRSFDPVAAKSEIGEWKRKTLGAPRLQCSVPCMPVVNRAVNRVTWNHFLFGPAARPPAPPPFLPPRARPSGIRQ